MTTDSKEKGIDLHELMRSDAPKALKFEYAGKEWEFRYKRVTWEEHWDAIEGSIESDPEGKVGFNASSYWKTLLLKAIVSCPGGVPMTPALLHELDTEVIAKLTSVLPGPLLDRSVLSGNPKA